MNDLEREADVFCRALVGVAAPPAFVAAYVRAHRVGAVEPPSFATSPSPFDAFLVRFAAGTPFRARFADSYAVLFARGSLLRRKLILALALVESHAATSRLADTPARHSAPAFFARAALAAAGFVLRAAAAAVFFAPARLFLAGRRP